MIDKIKYESRKAWLDARMKGIGGSDAPVIMGAVKWKSPVQLWTEKVKALEEDKPDSEAMMAGRILEDPVARIYALRTGRSVTYPGENTIFRNSDFPWAFVSPDRLIDPPVGEISGMPKAAGLLEIKTSGAWAVAEWEDEPPLSAQIQLMHGLMVLGFDWGSVAGLLGGWHFQFKHSDIHRNPRYLVMLQEEEEAFWYNVQHEKMPEVDGSESCSNALKAFYPTENGEIIKLPKDAILWHHELQAAKKAIKEMEVEAESLKNRFRAAIAKNSSGILPNAEASFSLRVTTVQAKDVKASSYPQVTVRLIEREGYHTEPYSYRSLRVTNLLGKGEADGKKKDAPRKTDGSVRASYDGRKRKPALAGNVSGRAQKMPGRSQDF